MSKDTPEVGDVFEIPTSDYKVKCVVIDLRKQNRIYMLRKYKFDFEKGYTYDVGVLNEDIEPDYCRIIKKRAKYLGKSKANINDLFKTENEE